MMNAIEQHAQSNDALLEEFAARLNSVSQSAFRLELLPVYQVEEEVPYLEQFEKFGSQTIAPSDFNSDWHAILRVAKLRGASFRRCRLVETLGPYLRFELSWGYQKNIELGEDIRRLSSVHIRDACAKSGLKMIKDYWLFDNSDAYFMEYDFFGTFLGVRRVSPRLTSNIVKLSDELWNMSEPVEPFIYDALVSVR